MADTKVMVGRACAVGQAAAFFEEDQLSDMGLTTQDSLLIVKLDPSVPGPKLGALWDETLIISVFPEPSK